MHLWQPNAMQHQSPLICIKQWSTLIHTLTYFWSDFLFKSYDITMQGIPTSCHDHPWRHSLFPEKYEEKKKIFKVKKALETSETKCHPWLYYIW